MKWNFSNVKEEDFEVHRARILVIGTGGAGNNMVKSCSCVLYPSRKNKI